MSFSLIYLIQRFFYRLFDFVRHWYIDGFLWIVRQTVNLLERMDKSIALRVNLHYLFHPLYQDYSFIGYILGFIFRFGRIIFGSLVYLFIILAATAFYLFWAIAPIYILIVLSRNY